MKKSDINRIITAAAALALLLPACLSLTGCSNRLYALDGGGNRVGYLDADVIEEAYSEAECRAEAERLLMTELNAVSVYKPLAGEDTASYTFHSDELPADVTVYSGHIPYTDPATGNTVLYAHAYTDYYESVMACREYDAKKTAAKYGLDVKRSGQNCYAYISSYDQLENAYAYLDATNRLYDFTVDESEMTNILGDIRNRPTLTLFYRLPDNTDGIDYDIEEKIITLYYTVNHDEHAYVKDSLLGAMRERYIETLDRAGIKDPAITGEIRESYVKPALTRLCVNGEPVGAKQCDGFTLDPNIVFDYNWLMGDYFGDVRLCAPSDDYDVPPGRFGDDRNFRYLVELLGGRYESRPDDEKIPNNYRAQWWLGGDKYTASCMCYSNIPVMTNFFKNGEYMYVTHAYSKNMWGLENGYGAEDYYIRLTPKALGMLFGVEAVPDYESGTLDLITPEGYFDHEPPAPETPADDSEQFEEKFICEALWSANGLVKNHDHYIVYADDGSVIEELTTEESTHAECTQVARNVVMLRTHGEGNIDHLTFFHTDTKEISQLYYHAQLIEYPYILYAPPFSGEIGILNVENGANRVVITDGYIGADCLTSFTISDDGSKLNIRYTREKEMHEYKIHGESAEVTVDYILPE